jgi:hypothetical protein
MENTTKAKVLFDLFELVNFYYEERDKPSNINLFESLENCCNLLEVDFIEFRKQFGIKKFDDSF